MVSLAFPILKTFDTVSRLTQKQATTTVRFEHPDAPHRMRDVYAKKKVPEGLLRIEADPAGGRWRELIKLGGMQLENTYDLTVDGDEWTGTPTFLTWTTSSVHGFTIDFRHPDFTVLSLRGAPALTESKFFQDWFRYVESAGISRIAVG